MKKVFICAVSLLFTLNGAFALNTVFNENEKPATVTPTPTQSAKATQNVNSTYQSTKLQEQKFNSALTNLDDAQTELRNELADATTKYNDALAEKKKAVQNCRAQRSNLRALNRKMRNIESSKKAINKALEAGSNS